MWVNVQKSLVCHSLQENVHTHGCGCWVRGVGLLLWASTTGGQELAQELLQCYPKPTVWCQRDAGLGLLTLVAASEGSRGLMLECKHRSKRALLFWLSKCRHSLRCCSLRAACLCFPSYVVL